MKGWVILALAAIGGYAVFQWFEQKRGRYVAVSGELSGTAGPFTTSTGGVTGIGDYYVSPIASGVPVFPDYAIANGHGDQVAAAYHSNSFSTINGGPVYTPAFGPTENQNGGLTIF